MKLIPLSKTSKKNRGKYFAQVDDEDYEYLMQWNWYVHIFKETCYAGRTCRNSGSPKTIKLHRVIMNTPEDMMVDHRDKNGLNCTKENLRNCNRSENAANRMSVGNSKYLGVHFHKTKKKYESYICKNNKHYYIGTFDNEQEAAIAYNVKAIEYHREFAKLNIIE